MPTKHGLAALRLWLVGLTVAVALVGPPAAEASQGVRISVGRIEVRDILVAGRTYHLPDLEVSNPGSETARYEMLAAIVTGQADAPLDPAWVSFAPAAFELAPSGVQRVSVAITIPKQAKPDTYGGLLKAQLGASGAGIAVGAAAAARLTFSTAPPASTLDALSVAISGFLDATQPWPLVLLLALGLLIAVRFAARRWDIRIQRR